MPRFSNWLISISYAILAAAGAVAAVRVLEIDPALAGLAGILGFVVFAQLHVAINRARERRALLRDLGYLRDSGAALREEVDTLREQIAEDLDDLETRSERRNQQAVSEVRVLEALIRQMAEGLERKAQEAALEAVEEAEKAVQSGEDQNAVSKLFATIETAINDRDGSDEAERPEAARAFEGMSEEQFLKVIRASLRENRIDLYLQPTVTLPNRNPCYYEALSRLRNDAGELILPSQYLRVAETAGLMSIVDNLLLFRCVQMVRRVAKANARAIVFCNISMNSLRDQNFFPQFLDFMELSQDLAPNLVFEFTQEAVGEAEGPIAEKLSRLAALGFRFSYDHVNTLDLDLPELRQQNFRFVKISAKTLLERLQGEMANLHGADFIELLSRFGVDLIVDRVETEVEAETIRNIGVRFAQGFLFGEPRPLDEIEARIGAQIQPVEDEDGEPIKTLPYYGNKRAVAG